MIATSTLKGRLNAGKILVAPGVYDALSGSLAECAGAEAVYLSGASIAYTRLGRPDIGLVSMNEVAETVALIRDRIRLPIIVDGDTGWGNALNVERTVRVFERAGANAIQLEDQQYPKRCGHLAEKRLVSSAEMAGKIRAAVAARASADTLIIARTDAVAVEGFDAAIARARAYAAAGADALFVEAPGSNDQLAAIPKALSDGKGAGVLPLMANMVEGGLTPMRSAKELEALGFSLVIFPGGAVRALVHALAGFYGTIARDGTTDAFRPHMLDFTALNKVIGTPDMLARGKAYEDGSDR
jgi:2-methylisocitrate lyase-like PEP mutase family enzyme